MQRNDHYTHISGGPQPSGCFAGRHGEDQMPLVKAWALSGRLRFVDLFLAAGQVCQVSWNLTGKSIRRQ